MAALVRFFPSAYRAFFASFALLLLAACGRGVAVPTESSAVAAGSSIAVLSTAQSSLAATQADTPSSAAGPSPYAQPPGEATLETAILAGGCFWGMQEILRKIPGVVETEVGYSGGITDGPSYETVHLGTTGHAESVRIRFDPKRLSYSDLLEKWFFRMHDPTTKNRQGNDRGTQYRSAIFYTTPAQRAVAESVKARVDKSGKWHAPIVTEISAAGPFTRAEEYHQDYLQKVPNGYTCHFLRDL